MLGIASCTHLLCAPLPEGLAPVSVVGRVQEGLAWREWTRMGQEGVGQEEEVGGQNSPMHLLNQLVCEERDDDL